MQSAHRFPHKSRTQLADAIKKEWLDLPVVETAFHETERMGLPAAQRLRKRKDRNQKPGFCTGALDKFKSDCLLIAPSACECD